MSLFEINRPNSWRCRLRIGLFILGFVILEATGLDYLRMNNIKPNLLLILVVFFSLYLKPSSAYLLAVITGIFKDSLALHPWGSSILGFGIFSWIIVAWRRYIYKDSYLTQIIITSIVCLFFSLFSFFYAALLPAKSAGGVCLLPLEFLYTGLISPFVLFLLRKAFR